MLIVSSVYKYYYIYLSVAEISKSSVGAFFGSLVVFGDPVRYITKWVTGGTMGTLVSRTILWGTSKETGVGLYMAYPLWYVRVRPVNTLYTVWGYGIG